MKRWHLMYKDNGVLTRKPCSFFEEKKYYLTYMIIKIYRILKHFPFNIFHTILINEQKIICNYLHIVAHITSL